MSKQFLSAAHPPLPLRRGATRRATSPRGRGKRGTSAIFDNPPPLGSPSGGAVSHRLTERAERHNTQQGYKT